MSRRPSKGISIQWHPLALVVVSLIGCTVAVVEAHDYGDALHYVWKSLILGLVVGVPVIACARRDLLTNSELYVLEALNMLTPKARKDHLNRQIRLGFMLLLTWALIVVVSDVLDIRNRSGLAVPLILFIALYPEQKAIYQAAKEKLEEDQPQMDA